MGELLNKAILYATEKHANQKSRKMEHVPYIMHPLEVSTIIASMTANESAMVAGLLHDVVEDTETPLEDIREKFGDYVAFLVSTETENKRKDRPSSETWSIRKKETIEILKHTDDINVKILWVGDKLANMRSICRTYTVIGDDLFNYFNNTNKNEHKWYYSEIINATKELSDTLAWQELKEKFIYVFGE